MRISFDWCVTGLLAVATVVLFAYIWVNGSMSSVDLQDYYMTLFVNS